MRFSWHTFYSNWNVINERNNRIQITKSDIDEIKG